MASEPTSLDGPTLVGPPSLAATVHRDEPAPPHSAADPPEIGRYRVTGRLGAGAMGVVYAAYDEALDREVAIKLMHRDDHPRQGERLLREAQAMAKLSHPNVAQVYEAGVHADHVFIAMELIHGITLRRWLDAEPRGFAAIVEQFVAAGRGLQAAHAAGVVHRDFKPDNVLVGADGRVVVVDFGVAHLRRRLRLAPGPDTASGGAAEADSVDGAVVGTPAYMSPEQWLGGQVDPRSDQFALCAALFEAVHGRRPFAGDGAVELARNVLSGTLVPPPRPRRAPRWIDRTLARGLQVHPERRFPTMAALLAELSRERQRRRARWLAAIGGLALAGGLGFAANAVQDDPCAGAGERVQAVWSPERRAALAQTTAGEAAYAAATWQRVDSHLDGYAREWADAARDACVATYVRGEASEELLDRRGACLSTRLRALDAVLGAFEGLGAAALDRAVETLAGLPSIAPCADADYVQARIPPPPTPTLAAAVDALRDRLARARAAIGTVEARVQLPEVAALAHEAAALGYGPALAEAESLHGSVLVQAGDAAGGDVLARAYQHASVSGHDEVAFDTTLNLAATAEPAAAATWLIVAESLLGRLHASDLQQAHFHYTRLYRACVAGCTAPIDDLVAAIARHRRTVGEHHPSLAPLLAELANIHMLRRDSVEAEATYTEALALYTALLGPRHPRLVRSLGNLARLAILRNDTAAAAAHIARIREILGDDFSPANSLVLGLRRLEADLAWTTGDVAGAADILARGLAAAEQRHAPQLADQYVRLAVLRRVLGQRREALAELLAVDFAAAPPAIRLDAAAHIALLAAELGDAATARAQLASAQPLQDVARDLHVTGPLALAEARLAALDGRHDDAVRRLEALLATSDLEPPLRADALAALASLARDPAAARTHAAAAAAAYAEAGPNYRVLRAELAPWLGP